MEEPACPICLISSSSSCAGNEEDDDHGRSSLDETTMTNDDEQHRPREQREEERPILFLRTPCNHIFCRSCIERVLLLRPRRRQRGGGSNGMPTRGPCPMCRATISLFDLVLVVPPALTGVETATTTDEKRDGNDGSEESLVYRSDSNVHSWPSKYLRGFLLLFAPFPFFISTCEDLTPRASMVIKNDISRQLSIQATFTPSLHQPRRRFYINSKTVRRGWYN